MAIIRLADKYKSKQSVQLSPARTYISSSSGITGSVHVFPNRSITQKDNIDERLELAPMVEEGTEFSGKPIRPYDSNSLEARRIEIYQGQFGKFIGGMFADAIQYEYVVNFNGATYEPDENGNASSVPVAASYTGEYINGRLDTGNPPVEWDLYNGSTFYNGAAAVATRINDGAIFEYRSDDRWEDQFGDIHNRLAESDRDNNGKSFEIALGMLLDGANPFTEDHAYRAEAGTKGAKAALYEQYLLDNSLTQYNTAENQAMYAEGWKIGNSSFTNANSESDRLKYQFTGFKIFEDELGIPYLDAPLTNKEDVNAWPPEVKKWDASVIGNFVVKGYSDLSMHPRNATKKEIIRRRANHDIFSSGSLYQRNLANRIEDLEPYEYGWWVHNDQALCLSTYDTDKVPALCYHNTGGRYAINWQNQRVTFEMWIKPTKEQTNFGTICHLPGNYAIALIPDKDSRKNDYYERFRIGIYFGTKADKTEDPMNGFGGSPRPIFPYQSVNASSGPNEDGYYVTSPMLKKDNWHHVAIRFGQDFNNGLLNVYIDGISETTTNVDGIHNGSNRTNGFINTNIASSAEDTLLIGAWSDQNGMTDIHGHYAGKQELRRDGNTTSYADGYSVNPRYQLNSELGEFRIWTTCRSELELSSYKLTTLKTTTDLKCYINFQFDPRDGVPVWQHKGFKPNSKGASTLEYYTDGTLLNVTSNNLANDYNKTQFCTNSAYIVGMPFLNVHSHFREYVAQSYPVITRFLNFTDDTDLTLYPKLENQTPADENLLYFINHWEKFNWLQNMNSMVIPCDNRSVEQVYDLNAQVYHKGQQPHMIKLLGSGIASTSDQYEIAHFLDDEVFAIQDAVTAIDPDRKVFDGKEENYQTNALVTNNKLVDIDYISPISTVFSIPQIYYGNRIKHESLVIKFKINSGNKVITLRDYEGTLYRSDAETESYGAKVGHVDYGTGVVCIFSPLLVNVGLIDFEIQLKGSKNMHVMQLDIPCGEGIANKSQNPTYQKLKASANSNETDGNVTYISTIYLHDENLNIIGKVNLTKPMQKREEDSFIFRVKVDF